MHARPLATRLLVAAAVCAVAAASTSVTAGAASSTGATSTGPTATLPLAGLTGQLIYLSDSDNYSSSGRVTLAEAAPDGAGRRVLISATNTSAVLDLLTPSPDGSQLAYARATSSSARIEVMNLATTKVATAYTLKGKNAYITGITWSADGSHLIFGSNVRPGASPAKDSALYEVPVGGGALQRLTPFDDAGFPAVAPDGDLVYVTSKTFSSTTASYAKSQLWLAGPDGSDPHELLSDPKFIAQPSVSPDGQTIVFAVTSSLTTSHLAEVGITGQGFADLTPAVSGRSDILPAWSPDGGEIAFLSSRAGRYESSRSNQLMDAYVMTAAGAEVTPMIAFTGKAKSVDLFTWAG